MTHDPQAIQTSKSKKRQSSKTSQRSSASKVKSTIHLSLETSQRLDIHVAMMPGYDRSSLIEQLITTHLRRYVVSDRGGAEAGTDGAENDSNSSVSEG